MSVICILRIQSENRKRHEFRLSVDRFVNVDHVRVPSGVVMRCKGDATIPRIHTRHVSAYTPSYLKKNDAKRKESEVNRQVAVQRLHAFSLFYHSA